MNPICKRDIDSVECQKWMSEVFAHCKRLLGDTQLEFLEDWWMNEQPLPFYQLPHLMSAYDCQKLKKEIAREMAVASTESDLMNEEAFEGFWKTPLFLFVVCISLLIVASIIWLLNRTLRRLAHPRFYSYGDCEYEGCSGYKCRTPRSFISFGRASSPLSCYGPYRTRTIAVPCRACRNSRR